jgi:hypothetical protein
MRTWRVDLGVISGRAPEKIHILRPNERLLLQFRCDRELLSSLRFSNDKSLPHLLRVDGEIHQCMIDMAENAQSLERWACQLQIFRKGISARPICVRTFLIVCDRPPVR